MKYTKEVTDLITKAYKEEPSQNTVKKLAEELSVPDRSIIAKLSSLGIYKKKEYVNKRGEPPTKKAEHIENIANLLNINLELLDSLEKVNKSVLLIIERELGKNVDPKSEQPSKSISPDPKS